MLWGRLHLVGRRDRLIISGGEKIDPHEVEVVIRQQAGVRDVLAVIGWPDPEWGQLLVALYILCGSGARCARVGCGIRADLANYKLPKRMIKVPRLPLNERGKVDRQLLERLIDESLRVDG